MSRNYSNKHVTRIQEILVTNIFVTRIAKNGDTKLNIRALNFLALQGEFVSSVVEGRLPVRKLVVLISEILLIRMSMRWGKQ